MSLEIVQHVNACPEKSKETPVILLRVWHEPLKNIVHRDYYKLGKTSLSSGLPAPHTAFFKLNLENMDQTYSASRSQKVLLHVVEVPIVPN